MTRSITTGSGNTDTSNYPNPFIINVGASRTFTNIRDAVDSLLGLRFNQQIIIQVDDGTYDHYPVYLDNPNLSGRLTIQGNNVLPANVNLTCIPDPLLNQRIKPGTQIGAHNAIYTLNNTSDFSNISYGFIAADGFRLKLNGFQINGSFIDQVNVTHCGIMAVNKASIFCLDNSMIIDGCMNAVAAIRFGRISINKAIFSQIQYVGVWAFFKSWVSANGSQFTGPGSSYAGITLTMPAFNGLGTSSTTYKATPFMVHDGTICYFNGSSFDQFPAGASAHYQSYVFVDAGIWSNISDPSGCLQVGDRGSALADSSSFTNVTLPIVYNNSFLDISGSTFVGSISTGIAAYSNSLLNAYSTLAGLTNVGHPPSASGFTSNVTRADGGVIAYS